MMDTHAKRKFFQTNLLQWGEENRRDFPWRRTSDPYNVLISEILLQQTVAQQVVPVYEEFVSRFSSSEELAAADEDEVTDLLTPLGLQNRRAKALVKIGKLLSQTDVPINEDRLLELPFVGRYAANAILCFAHDKPNAVVDVNVLRIYSRVFGFDWKSDRDPEAWQFADEMLPDDQVKEYNLALLDFGAAVCTASNPSCSVCPMLGICNYYDSVIANEE